MSVTASNAIKKATPSNQSETVDQNPVLDFPVVGIGASAGGLEALEAFFSHLDPNNDIAFIVVIHQLPGHLSLLPDLLGRFTDMPVVPAENGLVLRENHVFVCPPGQNLAVFNHRLHLMEPVDYQASHLPIDYFFRSLAEDIKDRAVAAILSGTGSDGTLGLKWVKGQGGMTMAQEPCSAKFGGMPSSAIASGDVDFVLPADKMGQHLTDYAKGIFNKKADQLSVAQLISFEPIQKILLLLRNRTGHDLSAYKSTTIRRRIIRRMNIHRIANANDYVRFLQQNPHEIDELFKELLINVTHFFRDSEAYEALAQKALPKLLETKPDHSELRVWIPGCSSGEEAYSIGILLHESIEKLGRMVKFQIFATDLDETAITTAREGLYPTSIEADVSIGRLARFFKKQTKGYRICREIRDSVVFASQNLIKDPPFTHLDLISCRNLLIYLNAESQKELFPQFHYALNKEGILFLGTSESIGSFDDLFFTIDTKWKIYRRKNSSIRFPISKLSFSLGSAENESTAIQPSLALGPKTTQLAPQIEKFLLQRFAPVSVVINEHGKIIYVHGRTGCYLELSPGQPDMDIVELAREGLKIPLAAALRKVRKSRDSEAVYKRARVKVNDHYEEVALKLEKISEPESLSGLLLVSFEPGQSDKAATVSQQEMLFDHNDDRGQLEQELYFARESLKLTIEELETANQELKSANEELQSINEELQSSNEELETSKEEMQSLNEELNTVNSELQSKVEELSSVNDDTQNLLNASGIAAIFLDQKLNIKRFTRQALTLFKLNETDIGASLEELVSTLQYEDLIADAEQVLQTLIFRDKEVMSINGDRFLVRILPYRTAANMIDGLVITFININRLKQAEKRIHDTQMMRAMVQAIPHPLLVLDGKFKVIAANPAFYRSFNVTPEMVEFRDFFTIADGVWSAPELYGSLVKTRDQNVAFEGLIYNGEFPDIGLKRLRIDGCVLHKTSTDSANILIAIDDISDHLHAGKT